MEEHKENIHGKDVNVKMSDTKEEEKVGKSCCLAVCCRQSFLRLRSSDIEPTD